MSQFPDKDRDYKSIQMVALGNPLKEKTTPMVKDPSYLYYIYIDMWFRPPLNHTVISAGCLTRTGEASWFGGGESCLLRLKSPWGTATSNSNAVADQETEDMQW